MAQPGRKGQNSALLPSRRDMSERVLVCKYPESRHRSHTRRALVQKFRDLAGQEPVNTVVRLISFYEWQPKKIEMMAFGLFNEKLHRCFCSAK